MESKNCSTLFQINCSILTFVKCCSEGLETWLKLKCLLSKYLYNIKMRNAIVWMGWKRFPNCAWSFFHHKCLLTTNEFTIQFLDICQWWQFPAANILPTAGEGNVFTRVCLSTWEGMPNSAYWGCVPTGGVFVLLPTRQLYLLLPMGCGY